MLYKPKFCQFLPPFPFGGTAVYIWVFNIFSFFPQDFCVRARLLLIRLNSNQLWLNCIDLARWFWVIESSMTQWLSHDDSFCDSISVSLVLWGRFWSNQLCMNPLDLTRWLLVIWSLMTQWLSHYDSFSVTLVLVRRFWSNQLCLNPLDLTRWLWVME